MYVLEVREAARDDARRKGRPRDLGPQRAVVELDDAALDGQPPEHGADLGHVVARRGLNHNVPRPADHAGHERRESRESAAVEQLLQRAGRGAVKAAHSERMQPGKDDGGPPCHQVQQRLERVDLEGLELGPLLGDERRGETAVLA